VGGARGGRGGGVVGRWMGDGGEVGVVSSIHVKTRKQQSALHFISQIIKDE
jgi:hypothetical protein